jgi:hypothetical protein
MRFKLPPFYSREKEIDTLLLGGWLDPRVGREAGRKRNISCPYRICNVDIIQLKTY